MALFPHNHSTVKAGCLAALFSGGLTAGIGAILGALFGPLLFGDAHPFLAAVGAFGFSLVYLFFPAFVPFSGLLAIPVVSILVKRITVGLRPKSFFASFAVALILLTTCSAAFTALLLLRGESADRESQAKILLQENLRRDVIQIQDLNVDLDQSGLTLRPSLSGTLPGRYRVTYAVMDQQALLTQAWEVELPTEAGTLDLFIPLSAIQASYRQVRMGGAREPVIVGTMPFRVKAQLLLLSADSNAQVKNLPAESPDRKSEVEKTVTMELGRF